MGSSVAFQVVNAQTHEIEEATASVNSLLSVDGLRFMLTSVVPNFLGFTALGVVIVAMVGVGLAEEAGLKVSAAKNPGVLMDVSFDDKGDLDRESFLVEVKNGRQVVKEVLPPLSKK